MADPLALLVAELSRLPGVGPKTAQRLAHHVLRIPREEVDRLARTLVEVREALRPCSRCGAITTSDPCSTCTDPERDRAVLCVVEEPFNIPPIERTGEYSGLYHVLGGVLSPQRGVGPEELRIAGLLERLEGVEEVVLATNPDVEGEATALYLARLLRPRGVAVSRLAFGMPVGGDIEFTDEVTLGRSLAGRRPL